MPALRFAYDALELLGQAALGSAAIVAEAAEIAAEAQKKWGLVPPEEKRSLKLRILESCNSISITAEL